MHVALLIRSGVIVPPQTVTEEVGLEKNKIIGHYEEKLMYRERSGPLSSNCVYQIQKVFF